MKASGILDCLLLAVEKYYFEEKDFAFGGIFEPIYVVALEARLFILKVCLLQCL